MDMQPDSIRAVVGGQSGDMDDTDQAHQTIVRPTVEDDDDDILQREDNDSRSDLSSLTREPQQRPSSQQADRMHKAGSQRPRERTK